MDHLNRLHSHSTRMHHKLTATQALQHLDGYLTVEDYAIALLSRIEARDKLKAWAYLGKESPENYCWLPPFLPAVVYFA